MFATPRTTTATHWVAVVPKEIGRGLLSRFGCSRRLAQLLGRIERRGCSERRRPEEPGRIALLTRAGRRQRGHRSRGRRSRGSRLGWLRMVVVFAAVPRARAIVTAA